MPDNSVVQWQGDLVVKSLTGDRIAVKQNHQITISSFLIIDITKSGSIHFIILSGADLGGTYTIGTSIRMTTIMNNKTGVVDIYFNGSHVGSKSGGLGGGGMYDKCGAYVSRSGTGGLDDTWVNLKFWIGGSTSGGGNPPSAPVFSPAAGTYSSAQSVTITSSGSTSIHYTTDGSTPTASSATYSGPVAISTTGTTLSAIGVNSDGSSPVTSGTYIISTGGGGGAITLEAESLSPTGTGATVSTSADANASGGVVEFLNSTAAGQSITFTTPAITAGTYQVQLRYSANKTRGQHTVKIDGVQVGGTIDQFAANQSYVTTTLGNATLSGGAHTIVMTVTGKNASATQFYLTADSFTFTPVTVQQQVAAPTFSPTSGTLPLSVTISTTTAGASIRYTTDGSAPSETAGTIYSSPVLISSTTTLKAIAYEAGFTDSPVTSATYTSTPPPTFNFEAESLSPVGTGATVSTSSDANASGGVVEFLNSTAAGQIMTFTTPSMPAGTYQFQLRYWANTTRGQHTVKVDGVQVGATIDQFASAKAYVTVTLGNVTFASAGTHSIAMTVTGKNSAATQFYLTADRFTFAGQ